MRTLRTLLTIIAMLLALTAPCQATERYVLLNTSVAGECTDSIAPVGQYNLVLDGTWSGVVALQWSFNGGATWHTIKTYIAPTSEKGTEYEGGVVYRLLVVSLANGRIEGRISQ